MTKRFLPCNVTPEITIVLMEGLGGIPANGFDDSWRDAASHFWGIWVLIKQKDCEEGCKTCPFNDDYR